MSKPASVTEHEALLGQLEQIALGISQTFAPFCEVVVHDLRDPQHSILAIHNNLSGRQKGDPSTELGLARIADPEYPQLLTNYANQFADGRQAKSSSIGIKDSSGRYVAALCLNVDLTLFRSMERMLGQFSAVTSGAAPQESLDAPGVQALRTRIDQYAARLACTPRSLKPEDRRQLLRELREEGYMDVRRAMEAVALHLGVSRATVYSDAK
ncbi:helix-turn-helix transcriptional regulator [Bordetella avium]|uniref:helix-turn-helix transcriptional regulator n=1 Tax=Bordetella avium TaxID=521 RepID=UPI000E0CAA31|nr:PAS domain-containing protein [Bordetella avium]AZY49526.1 DNA-binding protein [Bordetella avium]AZY52922.1 DNA-binding protein [Bordetella avium]RIQ11698.1 transcriptional regulator [Bordetella avium]RIQ16118.1 transcriptional regulator [Bordetella avium]RIQ30273.1 transcriptional regulator [Bordetella avium]